MNKKQITTLIIVSIIFIIIIALILIKGNNSTNWITKVKKSDNYAIEGNNCNGKEIHVPKDTLDKIETKLNNISDNGPWTGDNNKCYVTLNISYNNGPKVEQITIKVIDKNSFVLSTNKEERYYTNSEELNNYINNLFIEY